MKKRAEKARTACTAGFLFLLFFMCMPFSARSAFLLSDQAISEINAGVVHPFAEDPLVVYIENFRQATVPASDFYWGDLNGFAPVNRPGFIAESMPETRYTLSFPNIYEGTTGYEDVPSPVPPARQAMFPWHYDPTEVTDVALSHFPPAAMKQFVDRGWGAVLTWVDDTDADPIMWNGQVLVPPDTVFMAAAHSTMDITTPMICLTVSPVPGLSSDDTRPDLSLAHDTANQLGTLCIRNVHVRVNGSITDPDSTVGNVIVVYPNF